MLSYASQKKSFTVFVSQKYKYGSLHKLLHSTEAGVHTVHNNEKIILNNFEMQAYLTASGDFAKLRIYLYIYISFG